MILLNIGCGGQRPQDPHWHNLDTLRTFLHPGTPERTNLDAEPRYHECDVLKQSLPFSDEAVDGILLQHVLEHMTCHEAVDALISCRRVLKPGGTLVASVPNADYFREVFVKDTRETAVELFGEPISEPQHYRFLDYALFHREHKQVLSFSGLVCLLYRSGFYYGELSSYHMHDDPCGADPVRSAINSQLNRRKFSAIVWATKNNQIP